MQKIIYANETSKIIANSSDEVVLLTQYINGEVVGEVPLYVEDFQELKALIVDINE